MEKINDVTHVLELSYNWTQAYESGLEIEKDLEEFKFRGVGWYEYGADTVLVLMDSVSWNYRIYVWNHGGVKQDFTWISALPVYKG
jgi:hypothetical protein